MRTRFFRSFVALASLMLAAGMTQPARAVPAEAAQRLTSATAATSTVPGAQAERLPGWCRPIGRSWLFGLCVF